MRHHQFVGFRSLRASCFARGLARAVIVAVALGRVPNANDGLAE